MLVLTDIFGIQASLDLFEVRWIAGLGTGDWWPRGRLGLGTGG